ncbi:MAG: hypothetical protein ACSLE9_07755 [Burkholderiaceae bacterium]
MQAITVIKPGRDARVQVAGHVYADSARGGNAYEYLIEAFGQAQVDLRRKATDESVVEIGMAADDALRVAFELIDRVALSEPTAISSNALRAQATAAYKALGLMLDRTVTDALLKAAR